MELGNDQVRCFDKSRTFPKRQRLGTNHTTESTDSGFLSLNTKINRYQIKQRRNLQVDDVLWCCTFILTVWYFELPVPLFTDSRVRRPFLFCSVLCQLSFFLIGIYLCSRIDKNSADEWPRIYPKLFFLANTLFMFSCIAFCFATWNLWNYWTIYIVFVTFMFTIVIISFV
ncbi:unnamed protein product [Litomosoides sigmodontis]|uniref:Uncharacterized protein n=1 Tax=Litomosoides sigmodontis TaxID=42156 RepID=A0A3P6UYT3_LITSI|nr:unnamed protein product [Litomosoides sigmodontis]